MKQDDFSQEKQNQNIYWWRTNGSSQIDLFSPKPSLEWQDADNNLDIECIKVDENIEYQGMLGFGAAATDAATSVIWNMPTSHRDALMDELFSSSSMSISALRLPMGSSDFARFSYTYNDTQGNLPDKDLSQFSIDIDKENTIPFIKAALTLNPDLKVFAAPWSAPAWMKDVKSLNGGSLLPEYYATYAQYFAAFIKAYKAEGISIFAVSPQNEPLHITPNYPSMFMSAKEQADFIGKFLGPTFAAEGITTKIIAYDHNWDNASYPANVLTDKKANKVIDGIAWHAYAGEVSAQTSIHSQFQDKHTYLTEITASHPGNFGKDLLWHMIHIMLGAPNNWARCTIYWNLALNENNGPLNGGYTKGQGVVQVNSSSNKVTRYAPYYAIKHLSAVVKPGAIRIGLSRIHHNILSSAYKNLDGSKVLVLACNAKSKCNFKILWNSKQIVLSMNPQDVLTLQWI